MWENIARRDLHPSAGGLEFRYSRVCRCLVAAGARPTVIFITGFDEPRARKRAAERNAATLLTKPFRGIDLVVAVKEAVGRPQPRPGRT